MELRWISAFVAVAEELHFGRAADRLGVGQSPLSQTVRKLEKELATTLFERSTRSVALTPAGRSFLPHARRMLDELDLGFRSVSAASTGEYGHVTIGFSGALNHLTLPPLTRSARHRYPGIALSLVHQVVTEQALRQLQSGEIHLAFVGLPVQAPDVRTRSIAREPLGAILPSDHPFADKVQIDLSELAQDDFVALPTHLGSSLRETMIQACLAKGFRPKIVQEVVDPYLVLSFVAAGVGVSLMPTCVEPIMPAGSVFVPLQGPVPIVETGIAWNPENMSRALEIILGVAEETLPTPV